MAALAVTTRRDHRDQTIARPVAATDRQIDPGIVHRRFHDRLGATPPSENHTADDHEGASAIRQRDCGLSTLARACREPSARRCRGASGDRLDRGIGRGINPSAGLGGCRHDPRRPGPTPLSLGPKYAATYIERLLSRIRERIV